MENYLFLVVSLPNLRNNSPLTFATEEYSQKEENVISILNAIKNFTNIYMEDILRYVLAISDC